MGLKYFREFWRDETFCMSLKNTLCMSGYKFLFAFFTPVAFKELPARSLGRIGFLDEPRMFWGVAVGLDLWKETGWNAIVYPAAISGVNPELYEAAKIDGASRLKCI